MTAEPSGATHIFLKLMHNKYLHIFFAAPSLIQVLIIKVALAFIAYLRQLLADVIGRHF